MFSLKVNWQWEFLHLIQMGKGPAQHHDAHSYETTKEEPSAKRLENPWLFAKSTFFAERIFSSFMYMYRNDISASSIEKHVITFSGD